MSSRTEYVFGEAQLPSGGTLSITSPRAGLAFLDNEKVDVQAKLSGATRSITVSFSVEEFEGAFRQTGNVTVQPPDGKADLQLSLPNRGLFKLTLTATEGGSTVTAESNIAVLFAPAEPSEDSRWGIFYYQPQSARADYPDELADSVRNLRVLGASWVRLNFWARSYGKVTVTEGNQPRAEADCTFWKQVAREIRRQGMHIMGEVAQGPRELSSVPEDTPDLGDAGPLWCRVKPRDWRLWDSMMENLAAGFRDEISVWEIWNEPDMANRYWTGTVEDFIELVQRTAAALRKGNPRAKIAAGGFTSINAFVEQVVAQAGRSLDILTFHYSDYCPSLGDAWRALMSKYGLSLPMWNTEERAEVPLRDIAGGIEKSFKFIHTEIGYQEYRPLVRTDLTVLPSGVWFSVAARCIGDAEFVEHVSHNGVEGYFFRSGQEAIAVLGGVLGRRKLLLARPSITVAAQPLQAGKGLTVTDMWGRSREAAILDGKAQFELDSPIVYVRGATSIELAGVAGDNAGTIMCEAHRGKWSSCWTVKDRGSHCEDTTVGIWTEDEPDSQGHWVELRLGVPRAGRYELLFVGYPVSGVRAPASMSPFVWSIDGGTEHRPDGSEKVIYDGSGETEGVSVLGQVELGAGEHTFRIRLTARRVQYDNRYGLWLDAIALRPAK